MAFDFKKEYKEFSVIRLPDFITKADFDWAVETATKKKKLDCSSAEFMTIEEGLHRLTRAHSPLSCAMDK